MSKQTIRVLCILLTVCFLMSITIAAVSADPCSILSQKYSKGMMQGMQGMQGKEMMKEKPIKIRNLIIAKNVVIINGRTTHPLMRAALLKGMMNNKEMMSTSGTMNTGTTTGTTEKSCTAGNTANTETENTATAEANTTDC